MPQEKKEIVFDYLSQRGPNYYQAIGRFLLARNLKVPIGDYSASLVHAACCISETENKPEFEEIRYIMRKRWLWVFNRNLWTPKGVYVVPDLNAVGTSQTLNQNELEKMLKGGKELSWSGIRFGEDGRVRFAPKESYKLGEQTPESLAKDGFVIASYGIEGAEKLGEVASKLKYYPKTYGLEQKGQNPEQTVSGLYDADGDRLYIIGGYDGDEPGVNGKSGYAFGILK